MLNIPTQQATVGAGVAAGTRLVRMTYVDNSGLFNAHQEPCIVAAGVLINADKTLVAVEDHLRELVEKHIPREDWRGFVWHATELWSGSRYFKRGDERWPLEKRLEMLADLAAIPQKFDIQIAFGWFDRAHMANYQFPPGFTARQKDLVVFRDTFTRFCESVESAMREIWPDEVTIIVAEDQDSIRNMIKEAHRLYRDPEYIQRANSKLTYFPFTHIRDTVHFATKAESAHLQIADLCTFIVKRRLMEDEKIRPLYAAIKPQMLDLMSGESEESESW